MVETATAGDMAEVDTRLGDDGVAVVTFRRGRHNYFDVDTLEKLAHAFEDAAGRGARAVVLRSGVRHFCVGADFSDGPNPGAAGAAHVYDLVPRLLRAPVPVVAAVGGAAIGGGLGLALVADFRVTTPQAYFTANFARLGLSQGFALSATLPRLVGPQSAAELLYTGRRVEGAEAVAIGLCDRLVEPEVLDAEAHQLAAGIAGSAPLAVAAIRRQLRHDLVESVEATIRTERADQALLKASADFAEGTAAMRAKRPPVFHGR